MLKLKNISKNNNIISADYYPENSSEIGKICIDINSGEIMEKQLTTYDEIFPLYFDHAVSYLKNISKLDNYPKEKLVMWY